MRKIWYETISDLFVNLAAGWFGAVFVLPVVVGDKNINYGILIFDVVASIVCLVVSVFLRRKI